MGDEARLVDIVVGAQADAAKPRALVVIPMFHAVEAQLILEQVSEQPGKTPGGQRLPTGIIDPGAVMGVEPAVLMCVAVALVQLVGTPDIHHRQGVPLVIRAGIKDERLVGPLSERVGVDQALCPCRLKAGDEGRGLLEQCLHLRIGEGEYPVEDPRDFWCEIPMPGTRVPREQIPRHGGALPEGHGETPTHQARGVIRRLHGLIGRHDDHNRGYLGALRFEFFLHADKVLPGNGFEGIDRSAIALGIGDHHEHLAPQLTQLKAVRFEVLEFGGHGILTAHQGHQQPGIGAFARPARAEGFEVTLQIHAARHHRLGVGPEHLHLVMGTAYRLMEPCLRHGAGGLGVVGVGELPREGALGSVRVERHGIQTEGAILEGEPARRFQRHGLG